MGSANEYADKTGYYVIGINRKEMNDSEVKEKFNYIIRKFKKQ